MSQPNGTVGLQDEEIIFDEGCKSEDNDDEDFDEDEDDRDGQTMPRNSNGFVPQKGVCSSSADELDEDPASKASEEQSQTDISLNSGSPSSVVSFKESQIHNINEGLTMYSQIARYQPAPPIGTKLQN